MTFPTSYADQATYLQSLVARLNILESQNSVIVVTKTTRPKQQDFVAAWLAAGLTLPILPGYEFHWWDGTQVRGVYGSADDGWTFIKHGASNISCSPLTTEEVVLTSDYFNTTYNGIFISPIDRIDQRTLVYGVVGNYAFSPCFDSTAQNIAFGLFTGGLNQIYKMTRAGGSVTALASTGTNAGPHWRNNTIVFQSDRAPHAGTYEIYSMTDTGASQTRLTSAGGRSIQPKLSWDATKIVFISNRGGSDQIWTMNVNGSSQTNLGISAVDAVWSRDGSKIFYIQNRAVINNTYNRSSWYSPGAARNVSEIWQCDANGANPTKLTDYYSYNEPGDDVVNFAKDETYTYNKSDLGNALREALYLSLDIPADESRFFVSVTNAPSSPVFHVACVAKARKFNGSTGRVYRQITADQPYGDFELLESFQPSIATLTQWRSTAMANRPELSTLMILVYSKTIDAALDVNNLLATFNDDVATSRYVAYEDYAIGATPFAAEQLNTFGGILMLGSATTKNDANVMGGSMSYIVGYNDSDNLKEMFGVAQSAYGYAVANQRQVGQFMGLWNSTAPITSITFKTLTGTPFQIGTMISIYGLAGSPRFTES